jgi:hypothetical protein
MLLDGIDFSPDGYRSSGHDNRGTSKKKGNVKLLEHQRGVGQEFSDT